MKILIALLAVLVIGVCFGWQLGKLRRNGEPHIALRTSSTLAPASNPVTGTSMLDVLECHDKVVLHGGDTLILPKEVETLFGATNVDHFISNFGGKAPIWNSVAYFAGRYTLSLRFPIAIDYEQCKLDGAINSAQIQINETIKVEISKSGVAGATERGQWRLNENEWKWLVKNNGDWSVVNVPIMTNSPIKDFDEFVRQGREPIRNRKEGFDKPVRQALESLRKRQSSTNANEIPTK
ncbi:MAG: hypothetical protein ABIV39_04500 [Verrucomicrobiota bacterium]